MFARFDAIVLFFFNDTATTEIYTLSLHDALPIYALHFEDMPTLRQPYLLLTFGGWSDAADRSEEHTSELQSQSNVVCRLMLEKKTNSLSAVVSSHRDVAPVLLLQSSPSLTLLPAD